MLPVQWILGNPQILCQVSHIKRTCINFVGDSISSSVSAGCGRTNSGETPALLNMVKQPHRQNCYRLILRAPLVHTLIKFVLMNWNVESARIDVEKYPSKPSKNSEAQSIYGVTPMVAAVSLYHIETSPVLGYLKRCDFRGCTPKSVFSCKCP